MLLLIFDQRLNFVKFQRSNEDFLLIELCVQTSAENTRVNTDAHSTPDHLNNHVWLNPANVISWIRKWDFTRSGGGHVWLIGQGEQSAHPLALSHHHRHYHHHSTTTERIKSKKHQVYARIQSKKSDRMIWSRLRSRAQWGRKYTAKQNQKIGMTTPQHLTTLQVNKSREMKPDHNSPFANIHHGQESFARERKKRTPCNLSNL